MTSLMLHLRTKLVWCSCLIFSYLPKETGASILLRDIPLHGWVISPSVHSSSTAELSPLLALMWKLPKLWLGSSLTQRESRIIILLQMKIDWYIRVNSKTLSTGKTYQLAFQVSYSKILAGSLSYCCSLHWGLTWQDWDEAQLLSVWIQINYLIVKPPARDLRCISKFNTSSSCQSHQINYSSLIISCSRWKTLLNQGIVNLKLLFRALDRYFEEGLWISQWFFIYMLNIFSL